MKQEKDELPYNELPLKILLATTILAIILSFESVQLLLTRLF